MWANTAAPSRESPASCAACNAMTRLSCACCGSLVSKNSTRAARRLDSAIAAASGRRAASGTDAIKPTPSRTCVTTASCNWAGGTDQYMRR